MPEYLKEIFWDIDINELDVNKNKRFIISRILSFSKDESAKWMYKTYTDEDILDVAKNSRNLTLKAAIFLKNIYNLSEDEMIYFVNAKKMGNYYFI